MSHDPGAHGPHGTHGPEQPDPVASLLSKAQYVVTAVLLGGVAALMYNAGVQSTKGHGGEGSAAPKVATTVDVHALLTPSDALVAKGKSLFAVNCASCHGVGGKGDGPAAAALNPKPRNFTEAYWKYGGGTARIVQTITTGSSGTAMAAFPSIPLEDRFAIAHYVRTFGAKPDTDKPDDLAWLDQFGGGAKAGGEGTTAVAGGTAPAGPTIPIEKALALLAEAPEPAGLAMAGTTDGTGSGAAGTTGGKGQEMYARRCASCHGMSGEGGVRVRMIGSAPYAYVATRSLGAAGGEWASNPSKFESLVLRGIEGYVMPGNGDLTRSQLRELYSYTQTLRARQDAAGRSRS